MFELVDKDNNKIYAKMVYLRQVFSYECTTGKYFSYFSTKTYVVCTQKNCLKERVLLSTQMYAKIMGKKIFTVLP